MTIDHSGILDATDLVEFARGKVERVLLVRMVAPYETAGCRGLHEAVVRHLVREQLRFDRIRYEVAHA